MVYLAAYDMYVPVFFVLLQSKKCAAYYHAIQQCICASDWKMEAKSLTCDFEQSLIKSLKHQFPSAPAILCLFHWKQAIRRKLLSFHVPLNIIHQMIGKNGFMNILTVIPVDEIISKGIPYVRSKIDETGQKAKLDKFWKYFIQTWMVRYSPEDWNINGAIYNNDDDKLVNRTNNPLERFNRTLNNFFPNGHPSMPQFVEVLKDICNTTLEKLKLIQRGRDTAPACPSNNLWHT